MKLLVFEQQKTTNLNEFINYWSQLYSYPNENLYNNTIVKQQYSIADIQNLYVWKNNMRLSAPKQKSLESKIKAKLTIINTLKTIGDVDLNNFKKEFKNVSAVWKIFLLHSIKPNKYPIYDQHIHRAFLYIHNEDFSNISNDTIKDKAKETFYFERYVPYIESINIIDLKKLDEAFFAFGQFLNTRNYATLLC
tara:strand:+ start:495 stop:1073 length:579 start_codon:yes stop_codon:yes gene_type:complete